jgi:hypothetical protein
MIPFLLAAAGGYLIAQSRKDEDGGLMKDFEKNKKSWFFKDGGTIDEQLSAFDISNLDDYEKMRYDSLIKSVPKEKALQILINDVEGDYSQLSPKLRSLAKRCMAKGGKVDRYYIDYLNKKKNFKQDRKYFDSYNSAFSWAMENFERFDRDMIKIE